MAYHQPFQIIGFHSCDREVGLKVLNGQLELKDSDNEWDWLGSGVYFWEENPYRALQYANECSEGNQKNKIRIKIPFVIGAIIELGNCLNLLEPKSLNIVKQAHDSLEAVYKESGTKLPRNEGPKRKLDCAVMRYVHATRSKLDYEPFDTVRSSFEEGEKLYPGSTFTNRVHIEICVLNPQSIKGYFLPRPIKEFNPYLKGHR